MANKKSSQSAKNIKTKGGMPFLKIWNSPAGRPMLILLAVILVGGGVFIGSKLTNQASGFARTYKYKSGSAGFSFQYPADFTNATKPTVFGGDNSGYVAQQAEKDPDGAIIGFVRAIYTPNTEGNTNLFASLQQALNGSQSGIGAFNQEIGSSTYGDCSKDAVLLTTSSGKKLVECPLSGALGTSFKGDVLFGASSAGIYEFDYWIKTSYWSAHANAWDGMYKNVTYN